MVLESIGGMDLAGVGSNFLNIGIMIIVGVVGIGIMVALMFAYFAWKKYQQFNVIIFERDGSGQLSRTTDQAGIFVDKKTNNKRLFLKKYNVGLNADKVPYIMGPGSTKTIYLYREGLKNFHYITFKSLEETTFDIDVGEEDVNWAVNAYERQKKMFSNTLLMQLMPYIALAIVSIAILVIFIYFFKDFAVLKDVAVNLKEAAIAIAQAKSGTTVIAGTP